jgi:hypothetical protein
LAKKEAKRRKKETAPEVVVARMLGYTDSNNPFNDTKLSEKFVWKAKNDKLRAEGHDPAAYARERERNRRVALIDEVRAVKERRDERSAERELWEREQRRVQLERELGTLEEWQAHEEAFHLEQARKRSALRLQAGRAAPVDLLARRLVTSASSAGADPLADIAVADAEFDMREPHVFVESLAPADLAQLRADIDTYINIAKDNPDHLRYWRALLVVVDDLLSAGAARDRSAVHSAVHADVSSVLVGKSVSELVALRDQVTAKLASGDEGVDAGYWEHLLSRLRIQLARVTLSDIHAGHLERQLLRLEQIEQEQPATTAAAAATDEAAVVAATPTPAVVPATTQAAAVPAKLPKPTAPVASAATAVPVAAQETSAPSAEDSRLAKVAVAEMGNEEDGDAQFDGVVELAHTVYAWTDKYRPRKPRFLNRVHSGFLWNAFNRTHYDHDNPPPKTVQGYKFNIFYPDLVDKSKTPSYRLLPSENPETVLLVFHAGPPYEDIAFKIVNGEWATGKRSGFRCRFQNGVLSLFFNFQSVRYRK